MCLAAWAVGAAAQHRAAAADPPIVLGARYIDKINGYSLRPPALASRRREYSRSRLVSWMMRDTSTGAVNLTFTVLKRTGVKKTVDLKAYATALKRVLAREQQLYLSALRLTKVAGKNAIDLSGTGGLSGPGLWQRQVWIHQREGQFLILAISGSKARKDVLNAAFTAIVASVQLIDPAQAIKVRNANLKRGQDLLAGLTTTKLAAAFDGQGRWYLLAKGGKDVGYMYIKAAPARRDRVDGYGVTSVLRLQLPKDKVRRARREQFSTANRDFSRWNETMDVGAGTARYVEEGIKQGDMALCTITSGGQERTNKKRLNVDTQKIFLPRAFGMVLPRLVDLKTRRTYAFATYTSQVNDFDVRTFTVTGSETVTVGARRIEAVRVLDQAADDAEPATVWVDARGAILRMTTPDGLVMEASTRAAVIRRFPADEVRIRTLRP